MVRLLQFYGTPRHAALLFVRMDMNQRGQRPLSILPQYGITRSAEPIDFARPEPRRDLQSIVSRAQPYRRGTP
jgi:hypothetical protein